MTDPKDLRIIFLGTPEFAVASLRALVENSYNVVGVVTAPDKPAGRGQKLRQSAVKEYALSAGLHIMQPHKLKDATFLAELADLKADLGIVIAFRMLPKEVWSMPRLGTFNLHASLLPDYRGAAPINRAIMNGDTVTGVTTFMINEKIDTGDILYQDVVEILPHDNAGTLHDKLMEKGSGLVLRTVDNIEAGIAGIRHQNPADHIYKPAPKIFREDCRIEWTRPSQEIINHIRGLSPYPGAWTTIASGEGEVEIKIFDAVPDGSCHNFRPGEIKTDHRKELAVASTDGWVVLNEVQVAGKRRMKAEELLRGMKMEPLIYMK